MRVGDIIDGRYEIAALIGSGGMGEVYRARRLLLGDEVAIKVIRAEGLDDERRDRFMDEGRTCASLRHPNIVSILDFNIHEGQPFLVMELLNGSSLKEQTTASGPLDMENACQVLGAVVRALEVAHGRGVVHRDLKPANIMSHRFDTGEMVYKVIDFGVANIRSGDTAVTVASGLGEIVGTIAYAAPEQLNGEPADPRSDVYSLGAVAFELLTGQPPYGRAEPLQILARMMSADPSPRPGSLRPGLPASVDAAIARALDKDPTARWSSVRDFYRAFLAEDEVTIVARPTSSQVSASYEIDAPLGHGRMGSVIFTGRHRAMGHPVAIRIIHRSGQINWDVARGRFLREARAMQVAHPSILQVRDYGEDGDMAYIVTNFVPGRSLREVLTTDAPLSWPRMKPLLLDIVSAVRALHEQGTMAFGLVPDMMRTTQYDNRERVLISSAGIGEIQDLLASLSDDTLRGSEMADRELLYVAPELLMGGAPEVRTDVYAIGVVAYEMATGVVPHTARTLPQLMGATLTATVRDPREYAPGFPAAAAAAIVRCLARNPAERLPTAAAVENAVRTA